MTALDWLIVAALLTMASFLPYVAVRGPALGNPLAPFGNPTPEFDTKLPEWAQRAKKAHANQVENLVVFAPLVLAATGAGADAATCASAAMLYVIARAVYGVVYIAGIPYLRTALFLVGIGADGWLAWLGLTA